MRRNIVKIRITPNWTKKGDVITNADYIKYKVIKVYKFNLWRKILQFFGFKFKLLNHIKMKQL